MVQVLEVAVVLTNTRSKIGRVCSIAGTVSVKVRGFCVVTVTRIDIYFEHLETNDSIAVRTVRVANLTVFLWLLLTDYSGQVL